MSACREYEERISAFIDGCLPERDRAELEAHMAACPVCQAYFDDQIAIHEALLDLEEIPAPPELAGRIMERVRAEAQEPPAHKKTVLLPSWRRWAALAACCAIAAAGLWGGLRQSRADQPQVAAYAALPADGGEETLTDWSLDAPAIQILEDASPQEKAAEADAPALASPTVRDAAKSAPETARTLTTASPLAQAWVEERLGLPWNPGQTYALSAEEYSDLRALLAEAGEDFAETSGQPEEYLLAAE